MKGLVCVLLVACAVAAVAATPLDDYYNAPDDTYTYELRSTLEAKEYTTYMLRMTSQTWLTPKDSDSSVWKHWLVVTVPHEQATSKALIYVNDGHTHDGVPTKTDPMMEIVSLSTKNVVAELHQIPDEPITFPQYGGGRSEDAAIAATWRHFIDHPDQPEWLLRMPMCKAVRRAMDTVQDFVAKLGNGLKPIDGFTIAGASKRGWVTWLMGPLDKRVEAIVPIVLAIPNTVANINSEYQAYGNWSFALEDYLNMKLMADLNTPNFKKMMDIIDPLSYVDRLDLPKYIIAATGDEFLMPDSPKFFMDKMPGETHLWMVPNCEHSMTGHQISASFAVAGFFHHIANQIPRPNVEYKILNDPDSRTWKIVASLDVKPHSATMWHAHNKHARDFRLITAVKPKVHINPVLWAPKPLFNKGAGERWVYEAELKEPAEGWAAFVIQFNFKDGPDLPIFTDHWMKMSSEVMVIPDVYPYPPCGQHCQ